ncbi:MAG TPA: hypothetical protein VD969_14380 [Symbiobacteriaceae bacterium]|nr:hypothetical protein [Symbiobacteriaceae bacterium]
MRDIGKALSRGLKDWVDEGVCPPELLTRIEVTLRPMRRRAWWQSWPAYAGAVAAVFLVLLVVASRSTDLSQQIASIPLVGGLATNLLYPGTDVEVLNLTEPGEPVASTEHDGVRLDAYAPALGTNAVRIQYALRGAVLDSQAGRNRYQAVLSGPNGTIKFRHLTIERTDDEVLVSAEYEPVLPGRALTLTLSNLPVQVPVPPAVWQVTINP